MNKLYKEFAEYYAVMTNDRDFKGQLECILKEYKLESPCQNLIELFAGQSLHSIEALKKGIDAWAIDSSMEMKYLALKGGFTNPDQYIVGDLPDAILNCIDKKFDCVICLCYSISCLNKTSLLMMLKNIKKILSPKGKVFIEIHDINNIMEYVANTNVQFIEIKELDGGKVKFAWPSGKIKWDHYSYNAEVPIQLIVQSINGTETIDFTSQEYIYSTEDIAFLASLLGYNYKLMNYEAHWKVNFQDSIILELSL